MEKSSELSLNDVLGFVKVQSDYKINLVKDVRDALGGVKPVDKLILVRVEEGCFIKKREAELRRTL